MVSSVSTDGGGRGESIERKGSSKSKSSQLSCHITCLDGSDVDIEVDKSCKGEQLYEKVVKHLDIKEKEYVGLMFTATTKDKMWLDIHKDFKYQLGDAERNFQFRVKFYEPEPARLKDEYMRYLLYLQIREDIVSGRLECNQNTYALLGSYTAQAEIGDFNLSEHDHNYLDDYDFAPNQSPDLVKRVRELHKEHRGQAPAQAELNFLEVAKKIPRYGVDIHNAKDDDGPVEIGVAALGVNVYRNGRREYLFRWQMQDVILHSKRKFTVKLKKAEAIKEGDDSNKKAKSTFIYYFDSAKQCKQCYKSCIEYHTFFRLARPDSPRKKTDSLKLGSSFRYSDRTLYQLRQNPNSSFNDSLDSTTSFSRSPSKRRSVPVGGKRRIDDDEKPEDHVGLNSNDERNKKPKKDLVDEDNMQYEEVDMDEANPNDENYDPQEWKVVEKQLPDGTKRVVRRRIINQKIILQKAPADQKNTIHMDEGDEENVLEEKPIKGLLDTSLVDEAPIQMEEASNEQSANMDFDMDPSDWGLFEDTTPNDPKKIVKRRVYVTRIVKLSGEDGKKVEPEKPVTVQEAFVDDVPQPFDSNEWLPVYDDTGKAKVKRVILNKIVYKPMNDESLPMLMYEETPVDDNKPLTDQVYKPEDYELVERPTEDGKKEKVLRRVIATKLSPEDILVNVNNVKTDRSLPIQYEDVTTDGKPQELFNSPEWKSVSKKDDEQGRPDDLKRRIIVTKVIYKPADERNNDTPTMICDEVDASLNNLQDDQSYDPQVWELLNCKDPAGNERLVRRRLIVTKIAEPIVKTDDSPVELEEIPIDENDPEDEKYDPKDWEVIERINPDGKKVRYRRRRIIVRRIICKTPSKVPKVSADEPLINNEEVYFAECPDENFDPDEWEVIEAVQPDGSVKPLLRRRVLIKKIVYKPLIDAPIDQPALQYEDIEVDENIPLDDQVYSPKDYQLIEKSSPDGTVKKYLRRIILIRLSPDDIENTDSEEESVKALPVQYEEVEYLPYEDEKFDSPEWDIVEKNRPDGEKRKVRRRIIIAKVVYKPSSELSPPIKYEEQNANQETPFDTTKTWADLTFVSPSGEKKQIQRRVIVNKIGVPTSNLRQVPIEAFEYEEVPFDEANPEHEKYEDGNWEIVSKPKPDGSVMRIRRRVVVTSSRIVIHIKPKERKPSNDSLDDAINEVLDQPIDYEEIPIDESNPEDDKYDPTEWEVVEKKQPDGTVKKFRRRIIVSYVTTTRKIIVHPDGREEVVEETPPVETSEEVNEEPPIEYEEIPIDENNPEDEKYDPQEWEVVEKKQPDGTVKKFRRKIIVTYITTTRRIIVHPDGREEVVEETPPVETSEEVSEEPPIEYEEIPIDENNPEDDKYDPKEWEIIEKAQPDGSVKKYRRKIIVTYITSKRRIIIHPDGREETVEDTPAVETVKEVNEEPPIHFEEIPIDESSPDHDNFDPKEWEIIEKEHHDGTKIRVRRRMKPVVVHIKVPKDSKDDAVIDESIVPVDESSLENMVDEPEEIPLEDEENPEEFNPEEWEIIEKKQPDGTVKKFRRKIIVTYITTTRRIIVHPDGREEVVEETPPVETSEEVDEEPEYEELPIDESDPQHEKYDPNEWEIFEKEMPDGSKKPFRRRIIVITTTRNIILHPDGTEEVVDETQETNDTSLDVPKVDVNMDDLLSDLNTLSRSLDEQDWELSHTEEEKKDEKEQKRKAVEEANKKEAELQIETEKETEEEREKRLAEERKLREDHNRTIDSIFTLPEEETHVEARVPPLPDISTDNDEEFEFAVATPVDCASPVDGEIVRTASLLRDKTTDSPRNSSWRSSMGDDAPRRYNKRVMTEPTQRHSYAHDPSRDRKVSADTVNERTSSRSGYEQEDYHRPSEGGPHSEIIYTVKDVSQVEQGQGGFVKAVKAKHEVIANEETQAARRTSRHFSDDEPKGHVPTHSINIAPATESEVSHTRVPPAIPVKRTIVHPVASDDATDETVFAIKQSPVESYPELDVDIIEATDVPQVETQAVRFEEIPEGSDIVKVSPGNVPQGIDTQVIALHADEIILDDDNAVTSHCVITTEHLPTEVITKTITIEGDSSSMTQDELNELIRQSGGDLEEDENTTFTQVVKTTTVQKVITGRTITVSGDADVGDEELQKSGSTALGD